MIAAAKDVVSRADFYGGVGIMVGTVLVVGSFKQANMDSERAAKLGMFGATIVCFGTLSVFESSLVDYWDKRRTEALVAALVVLLAIAFVFVFTRARRPNVRPCFGDKRAEKKDAEAGEEDGI
jgi:uncharacterized membrane protein YqjE